MKVGRLMTVGFEGTRLPPELIAFADEFGLGGIILFKRNCHKAQHVVEMLSFMRERLKDAAGGRPPLVMVDQEGGRVERLYDDGVPRLPSAREMSEFDSDGLSQLAESQSVALRHLGIDVNLAPVCDVVRPGESGVIGDRSFGEDAKRASYGASTFYKGMREGGIRGCAKHYPGHGASVIDTHLAAGTVNLSEGELRRVDLPPFEALVRERVEFVMAAHLGYPEVDPLPAFLSRKWLVDILRDELGFRGAVISDDMEMAAASGERDAPHTALAAIEAGCDMLVYGRMIKPRLDIFEVARHLSRNLSRERYAEATGRLAALGPSR